MTKFFVFIFILLGLNHASLAQDAATVRMTPSAQNAYTLAKEARGRGDPKAEVDALAKACSGNAFEACHDLGVLFEDGTGTKQSYGRAADLYQLACNNKVAVSCANLGLLYEKGNGVAKDPVEALRLHSKACDLRHGNACNDVGYFFENAIGTTKDATAATKYFARGCALKYWGACDNLANAYLVGKGVKVDLGKALQIKIRACREYFQTACQSLEAIIPQIPSTLKLSLAKPQNKAEELEQLELEARLAFAAGKDEQAHEHLTRALKYLTENQTPGSELTLHFVLLRSKLYEEQRQPRRFARRVLEDQLATIDRAGAKVENIPFVLLLIKLSTFEEEAGDKGLAREHLGRAIELQVRLNIGDRANLGGGYNRLGILCSKLDDRHCAIDSFKKAQQIGEEFGNKTLAATSLNNVGSELMFVGDYEGAAKAFAQALSQRRNFLPEGDPNIAQNLGNLSFAYGALGDWKRAVEFATQQLDVYVKTLGRRIILREGSLESKYDSEIDPEWAGVLSWAITLDELSRGKDGSREFAATAVATLRGARSETLRAGINTLRASASPQTSSLLANLQLAQEALSAAYLIQPKEPGSWSQVISQARFRMSEAEGEILKASGAAEKQGIITEAAIKAAVPKEAALVLYSVYASTDAKARTGIARHGKLSLAAHILAPGRPTQFVNLGEASPILERRRSVLEKLAKSGAVKKDDLRALHKMVLEPVEQFTKNERELIIVPGEALAELPFEALVGTDGTFVIETKNVRYVSNASELLELSRVHAERRTELSKSIVLAAPDYADGPGLKLALANTLYFRQLPGAANEGQTVAQHLATQNLRFGRDATKSYLRSVKAPPLVHISSHSFFLSANNAPASIAEILRQGSEALQTQDGMYTLDIAVPAMVRAGVALAGANGEGAKTPKAHAHKGILTALELSSLDLRATQLVVLSACETGIGDATFGEGLDGMRSALRIAGARTRLMSLWRVSDCATLEFMDNWYRRMMAGEDRLGALRSTKLDMLRGAVLPTSKCFAGAVSATASDKQKAFWSDPYFWAPFIAEGANGRL